MVGCQALRRGPKRTLKKPLRFFSGSAGEDCAEMRFWASKAAWTRGSRRSVEACGARAVKGCMGRRGWGGAARAGCGGGAEIVGVWGSVTEYAEWDAAGERSSVINCWSWKRRDSTSRTQERT